MPWGNRSYQGLETPKKFWWNIDYTGNPIGCWIWLGSKSPPDYYGTVRVSGRTMKAHRHAWELTNGPISNGSSVLHKCDNPSCVNPGHLFLGTYKDNIQDAIAKGRFPSRRGERNGRAKLTESQIQEIKTKYQTGHYSYTVLAKEYRVTKTMIGYIIRGENWN